MQPNGLTEASSLRSAYYPEPLLVYVVEILLRKSSRVTLARIDWAARKKLLPLLLYLNKFHNLKEAKQ